MAGKLALHRAVNLQKHPDQAKGSMPIKACVPLEHDPDLRRHLANLASVKATFVAVPRDKKGSAKGVLRTEYLDSAVALTAAQAKMQALRSRLATTLSQHNMHHG